MDFSSSLSTSAVSLHQCCFSARASTLHQGAWLTSVEESVAKQGCSNSGTFQHFMFCIQTQTTTQVTNEEVTWEAGLAPTSGGVFHSVTASNSVHKNTHTLTVSTVTIMSTMNGQWSLSSPHQTLFFCWFFRRCSCLFISHFSNNCLCYTKLTMALKSKLC